MKRQYLTPDVRQFQLPDHFPSYSNKIQQSTQQIMSKNKGNINFNNIEMNYIEGPERDPYNPFEINDDEEPLEFNDSVPSYFDEDVLNRPNRTTSIHKNIYYGDSHSELKHSYLARTGGRTKSQSKAKPNPEDQLENHANQIVTKMEQDPCFMEDTPSSELLRKEALRDMPQCLTIKRHIKEKLAKSVSQKSKRRPISCVKRLKYQISMKFSKFKVALKNLTYTFELWYGALKEIEGHFGSGVASYFRFLRWIFILNCGIALLPIAFIVIPQILSVSLSSTKDNNASHVSDNNTKETFTAIDTFSGEGFFTNTLLYYGYYDSSISFADRTYSMSYAYFFTMAVVYFICLLVSSISAAASYRKSFIETEGGFKNIYAQKIFCGWDCSIATKQAADLKSAALYHELKELLSDEDIKSIKRTCLVFFWTRTIQIVAHLIVLMIIGAISYLVWDLKQNNSFHLSAIDLAIIINVIMQALPVFFSIIVRYEDYKDPRVTLGVTLFRSYLLGAFIVGVLTEFWLTHTLSSNEVECSKKTHSWEICLGQEMYRLIIFDFIFCVLLTAVLHFCVFLWCRWIRKTESCLEFNIASNTLQIIFNQTLLWIGFLFAPLLVIVVAIKLFITWYIQYVSILKFCKPSAKSWRAAQTQTWFLILTFLSCLLIISVHGYIIFTVKPSDIGPFRGLNYTYQLIVDIEIEGYSTYNKFYQPAFVVFILVSMMVRVYYLRAKCYAQRSLLNILREMLVWESKDKEFLLQHISKVTKGQWQYRLQETQLSDPVNNPPEIYNKRKSRYSFKDISEESSVSSLANLLQSQRPSTSGISLPSLDDSQRDSRWVYKKFT